MFDTPVDIAHADDNRLFIVEQAGVIRVASLISNADDSAFLDISSHFADGGERGLLGLAFHPDYKLRDLPRTPLKTLQRARDIAKARLNYIYLGNVGSDEGNHTKCPKCGQKVITRRGFVVSETKLTAENNCSSCGTTIPISGDTLIRKHSWGL